ncbi:MAG TPA: c-type cytochrome [Candidatus Solibacter sp.]|nr:c-type cytochrome [Candidatus Solibacter sp.]
MTHLFHKTLRAGLPWLLALTICSAQTPTKSAKTAAAGKTAPKSYPPELVQKGRALFRQECSFCHGREAGGGETGPDLTRSDLVAKDVNGNLIGPLVRNGRPDKGMPHFDRSDEQIASLVAFIHTQRNDSLAAGGRRGNGGRKGVDVADLQTGSVEAGKQYFEGAGGCAKCHSATGDLAGIASRYKGLKLEEQMLYPNDPKSRLTVTLPSGQTITGTLAYRDEFTVALTDSAGWYRSWRASDVQYKIDAPVNAHVEQFSKYTDADIHNLMAYLQTLH